MVVVRVEDPLHPLGSTRTPDEGIEVGVADHCSAAGTQYPIEFAHRPFDALDVLVDLHGDGPVERLAPDRQGSTVPARERHR